MGKPAEAGSGVAHVRCAIYRPYFERTSSTETHVIVGGPPPCHSPCGKVSSQYLPSFASRNSVVQPASDTAILSSERISCSIRLHASSPTTVPSTSIQLPTSTVSFSRSFITSENIPTQILILSNFRQPVFNVLGGDLNLAHVHVGGF